MKRTAVAVAAWCLLGSMLAFGQGGRPASQTTEVTTPEIPGVVAAGTKAQVVHTWEAGLGAEGPVSLPDGSAVFTQTSGRKIIKVDNNNVASVLVDLQPNQVFGLAYDLKGRVIGTHRGNPNGVVALWPTRAVLADRWEGRRFDRPNDIVIDTKGGVYFTDNSGVRDGQAPPADAAPPGVYYVRPDGQVLLASRGKPDCPPTCTAIERPNGIQLSPDGKVLYVATGGAARIVSAFDVQPDGRLSNPRDFAVLSPPGQPGGADGMVVDAAGRLYVAAASRLMVFSPQGKPLGTVTFPARIANLTFAGKDRRTLFIVGGTVAYKLPLLAEGVKGRAK